MTDSSENTEVSQDQDFHFGNLRVDPARNILHNGSESFHIEPRIMSVLCTLARHAGDVVTRDTLIETIWNVEYGADESLTRAISILRKTFRKAGEPGSHIETIPKSGYRLASQVSRKITPAQHKTRTNPEIFDTREPLKPKPAYFSLKQTILAIGIFIALAVLAVTGFKSFGGPIGAELATGNGRSVAILSFTDMSARQDQEHFSDGITEEIFTTLAEVPSLRIAARNSSFAYKGKPTNMRTIGQELNVSHVIDGSIRTQGEKIRITAQLINTADGLHVWTKSYDGLRDDMFGLQERVSRDIVLELRLVLTIGFEDVMPLDIDTSRDLSEARKK